MFSESHTSQNNKGTPIQLLFFDNIEYTSDFWKKSQLKNITFPKQM